MPICQYLCILCVAGSLSSEETLVSCLRPIKASILGDKQGKRAGESQDSASLLISDIPGPQDRTSLRG